MPLPSGDLIMGSTSLPPRKSFRESKQEWATSRDFLERMISSPSFLYPSLKSNYIKRPQATMKPPSPLFKKYRPMPAATTMVDMTRSFVVWTLFNLISIILSVNIRDRL